MTTQGSDEGSQMETRYEIEGVDREETLQILKERAALLSRSPAKAEFAEDETNVIVLPLGDERYAVPASSAREVQPLRQWARIPGAPPYGVGVVNIRSRIFPIVDVRHFLGVPERRPTAESFVVLVDAQLSDGADVAIAVLCDSRPSAQTIPLGKLRPWRRADDPSDEELVRGVTNDFVVLLDPERLLSYARNDAATPA